MKRKEVAACSVDFTTCSNCRYCRCQCHVYMQVKRQIFSIKVIISTWLKQENSRSKNTYEHSGYSAWWLRLRLGVLYPSLKSIGTVLPSCPWSQFPVSSGDGPGDWVSAMHTGHLDWIPSSWLQPLAWAVAGICRMRWEMGTFSFSLCLCL